MKMVGIWWGSARFGKKSLGEYGSGWGWDGTYPHVFDYAQKSIEIPMRYNNTISTSLPSINGTWVDYGGASSTEVANRYCNLQNTNGQTLVSYSTTKSQISCEPHAYNAGNMYNYSASAVGTLSALGSLVTSGSICPRGWFLPRDIADGSYSYLLQSYGVDSSANSRTNQDSALINSPLSFLRAGFYYNYYMEIVNYNSIGYYRAMTSVLDFSSGGLKPNDKLGDENGASLRCVKKKA